MAKVGYYDAWGRWKVKDERTTNPSRKGWSMSVIGIEGAEELFARAQKQFGDAKVQDALLPGAMMIRDYAKRLCPLGTGRTEDGRERPHLRDLIFATKGDRGMLTRIANAIRGENGPSVIVGVDRVKAPHAHLVEFGHAGPQPAPAHPYLRPALASNHSAVLEVITARLRALWNAI